MIQYSLTKKTIGKDNAGYVAIVNQSERTDLDKILDYMVAEGMGLTRSQALPFTKAVASEKNRFRRGGWFLVCYFSGQPPNVVL